MKEMDRYWLLTWTTYGTWLPGDERGFVSNVRAGAGPEVRHNSPDSAVDAGQRGLWLASREKMAGQPIYLTIEQTPLLLQQFQETARYREWELIAVGIMDNHIHILVGVRGDPEPETLLRDFKSYGSRPLNRKYGKPISETWWTEGGSKRKKEGDAIAACVDYIRKQWNPLLIWIHPDWRLEGEDASRPVQARGGRKPPDSMTRAMS